MIRILCSRAGISVLVVAAFACKSTTTPPTPVPTTIAVSSGTVSFDALGATETVTATVKDQDGATMSGQTVTWSSASASIASVSSGTISAVGNGTTTVTATSGSLTADVSVTVEQVATQLAKISGDAQSGTVGDTLADSIVVEMRDSRGHPVPGGTGGMIANSFINFTVATGDGSVTTDKVTVGADGRGATAWVLGTTPGEQTVTATTGVTTVPGVTFSATAMAGAADSLAIVSGDAQTGRIDQALQDPIVVLVTDRYGNPFGGGQPIAFDVLTGGGSTSADTVTTDAGGQASVIWTLGSTAGSQTLAATAVGLTNGSPADFSATAIAPDSMAIVKGDNQTGAIDTPLGDSIVVELLDDQNNPFPGHQVAFEVMTGGGSVSDDTVMTDADGHAGVVWTLGSTVGSQTLMVTGVGVPKGSPRTFTATGASQVATTLLKVAGDSLIGLVGKPTNIPPRVQLLDQADNPMAGVSITFNVTNGGGSTEGGAMKTVATDANGFAGVTDWTLGASAGSNTLEASTAGVAAQTFAATGQTAAFNIEVQFYGDTSQLSTGARAAFAAAEARWEALIFGDLPDLQVTLTAGQCDGAFSDHPAVNQLVDDVLILAKIDSIDGVGGTLGAAGPCVIRGGAGAPLPALGLMRFDSADVAAYVADGSFASIVLHEMGHVLGFGILWNQSPLSLLADPCPFPTTNCTTDPHVTGTQAIAAFDRVGGDAYTAGQKVPVEDCVSGVPSNCGTDPGHINSHWRESVFGTELMTPYISTGETPALSIVTVASFWDMSYLVNFADADPYAWPSPPPARQAGAGGVVIEMKNDIRRGPLLVVDESGRIIREYPN